MSMAMMYCPQCGRELELDSDVRFCRYCGLSLSDTKDTLRGYTEVKREGYKYTNLSYILLLVLFWIQYFDLVPWGSVWGGNFLFILIIGFIFGLWFMGNWVVDRPAGYVKAGRVGETPELAQGKADIPAKALLPSQGAPVPTPDKRSVRTKEIVKPASITEDTTRSLAE
jgi:zinc-ribbon domain